MNCSLTRLNISWMAVVLPRKVALILRPLGGMSHTCGSVNARARGESLMVSYVPPQLAPRTH